MKIGRIVDNIPEPGIVNLFLRHLLKPVVLNVIKGGSAVVGKVTQPPDGATLDNPKPEPVLTAGDTVKSRFPDKGSLTV